MSLKILIGLIGLGPGEDGLGFNDCAGKGVIVV
jgi:hypothetical protein